MRISIATFAVAALLATQAAWAQECGQPNCCARCGCRAACRPKVCRVVGGVEKVKKICWCVEQEDFCVPMPACGLLCGIFHECGIPIIPDCKVPSCSECGNCGRPDCAACCLPNRLVPPKCHHVGTRKILVPKEYECEVPIYKCVVQFLCGDCESKVEAEATEVPSPAPAAPPAPELERTPGPPLPPLPQSPPPAPAPARATSTAFPRMPW